MMGRVEQVVLTLNAQIKKSLQLEAIARSVLYQKLLPQTRGAAKKKYVLRGREEDLMEPVSSA